MWRRLEGSNLHVLPDITGFKPDKLRQPCEPPKLVDRDRFERSPSRLSARVLCQTELPHRENERLRLHRFPATL